MWEPPAESDAEGTRNVEQGCSLMGTFLYMNIQPAVVRVGQTSGQLPFIRARMSPNLHDFPQPLLSSLRSLLRVWADVSANPITAGDAQRERALHKD